MRVRMLPLGGVASLAALLAGFGGGAGTVEVPAVPSPMDLTVKQRRTMTMVHR